MQQKKNSNEMSNVIKVRDFDIVSKMVKFACHLIFSTAQRQSASYFKWYRANNKDVGMLKYKNLKLTIYLSKLRNSYVRYCLIVNIVRFSHCANHNHSIPL